MLTRALRRFSLKVLEERPRFTIYEVPRKVNKQQFMETKEWSSKPEPISVAFRPHVLENPRLGNKKYFWCACGLSKKQPFCDSSHFNTAFKPVPFYIQEKVDYVYLCLCKRASSAPYCDGHGCKPN